MNRNLPHRSKAGSRGGAGPTPGLHVLLGSTAEAAFASDQAGRITVWNDAAAALLGWKASEVTGRRCSDVIQGRDCFGNRFCSQICAVRKMRHHREPIHPFHMDAAAASGLPLRVECSILVAPGPDSRHHSLIHLIKPVGGSAATGCKDRDRCEPEAARPPLQADAQATTPPPRSLTPRETQVLRLVAAGSSNQEIALTLGVSPVTIDNHVQHILDKLEVHSRLQAVLVARSENLL